MTTREKTSRNPIPAHVSARTRSREQSAPDGVPGAGPLPANPKGGLTLADSQQQAPGLLLDAGPTQGAPKPCPFPLRPGEEEADGARGWGRLPRDRGGLCLPRDSAESDLSPEPLEHGKVPQERALLHRPSLPKTEMTGPRPLVPQDEVGADPQDPPLGHRNDRLSCLSH